MPEIIRFPGLVMTVLRSLLGTLALVACASTPVEAPPATGPAAPAAPDLSPAAVRAADPFLWLEEVNGELLIVSQFTLYGDARKGARPDFGAAMPTEAARTFYEEWIALLRRS